MNLLNAAEMRAADAFAINNGISGEFLMNRAGAFVADAVEKLNEGPVNTLILAGPGNNGGDAFVAARLLKQRGYNISLALICSLESLKGDARVMADSWLCCGGHINQQALGTGAKSLCKDLKGAEVIIDGLLGAGLDRPITGKLADLIDKINQCTVPIIAIDIPTGIEGDTGQIRGVAIKASHTVSFFRAKPGHYLLPGRTHCGSLSIHDIGIPGRAINQIKPNTWKNDPSLWRGAFRQSTQGQHKYNKGAALIVSGDTAMRGAATLACNAAINCGAGLVTTVLEKPEAPPPNLLSSIMITSFPEKAEGLFRIIKDRKITAALIGPGAKPDATTRSRVETLMNAGCHLVLDAGALTAFKGENLSKIVFSANSSKSKNITERNTHQTQFVMTPHEGEFEALFGKIGEEGKLAAARKAAVQINAIIILKGADTVIAAPDGRAIINTNAPSTLATAGTGDVLAGIITAFLANNMPGFEAAAAAAYIHAQAANQLDHEFPADELITQLPIAKSQILKG